MRNVIFFALWFLFNSKGFSQAIKEVKIGEQVWMGANLNVEKFRNGDPIPQAKTKSEWIKASEDKKPAWCYYQNNPQNGVIYGKLYNWYAVNDPRGLAPKGWHIPTRNEWDELISTLKKDFNDVNEALKTKIGWKNYETGGYETGDDCEYCNGTGQYYSSIRYSYITCVACGGTGGDRRYVKKRILSGNGTNTSSFSAKPGANRFDDGDFNKNIGLVAVWWFASETEPEETRAEYIYIDNDYYTPRIDKYNKGYGSSIRLVKDDLERMERERIALEEKKARELLEIQLKEERKRQEEEQERLRIIQAEKEEEERKLQAKLQDSIRKREKEISDSIKIENTNIELAMTLVGAPISYKKKAVIARDDWEGFASLALPFASKYLDNNWRIPTVNEMKKIIPFLERSYRLTILRFRWFRSFDFLCLDENNNLVILNVKGKGKDTNPPSRITFDFELKQYNPNEIINVRFIKDK